MQPFVCPDPTPAMIANAQKYGYDAYNLPGSAPLWDFRPDDTISAPSFIHDYEFLKGGPTSLLLDANLEFEKGCFYCARAHDEWVEFEEAKALVASQLVFAVGAGYWSIESRLDPELEAEFAPILIQAKQWINFCAQKIGEALPYPEIEKAP